MAHADVVIAPQPETPFWTRSVTELLAEHQSSETGLSGAQARHRLALDGPNADVAAPHTSLARSVLKRLFEPLSLILLAASLVSAGTGDMVGGTIIVFILALSVGLPKPWQGRRSGTCSD